MADDAKEKTAHGQTISYPFNPRQSTILSRLGKGSSFVAFHVEPAVDERKAQAKLVWMPHYTFKKNTRQLTAT